jgi:hypothetical protein
VRQTSKISRVQITEETRPASRDGEFEWLGREQQVHGLPRIALMEREESAKDRQVRPRDVRIVWKTLLCAPPRRRK